MKTGVLLVLASLVAAPVLAQRPASGSWAEQVRRLRGAHMTNRKPALPRVSRSAAPVAALAATILNEHEPNGTALTADSGSLGDQASAFIEPDGDVDFWFLDLTAGQFLSVDVLAMEAGSPLDPEIWLFAPDGTTVLRFNDDFDGFDSRISFRVVTTDRYYVAIRGFAGSTGRYAIDFGTVVCGAAGNEREPNDAPGTATPMAIGDRGSAEVCAHNDDPLGDVDYWAFTAQAGTAIELAVEAEQLGTFSDPFLALYASDGVTQLAFNDDEDGRDSRLQFSIATTGTYFAAVSTIADPGGNPFPYRLSVRLIAQGPGDPITVRAGGLGFPLGLAVGSTGDLFVGDVTGSRVLRISTAGIVSTFASGIAVPEGLAFDAFGNLLVVSIDGNVYRVTPAGQVAPFITDAGSPFWVAVGPDGRIWLTTLLDQSLRRYSAQGQFEARVDLRSIGGFGPGPLAIGPSGEPYVSNGAEIWKLVNGEPQRVLVEGSVIWAFAFDVTGNIYAPIPASGRIKLFDPTGALLADPYALGPDGPQAVAFGRDATGATVARLFASEPQLGQLIEVNPAGVEHPGLPPGFVPFPFSLDVAAASLLGAGGLSAADVQLLDALGNRNGRYDVGDFAAFIKTVADLGAGAQQRAGRNR